MIGGIYPMFAYCFETPSLGIEEKSNFEPEKDVDLKIEEKIEHGNNLLKETLESS